MMALCTFFQFLKFTTLPGTDMHVGKNFRRMDAILDLGKFLEVRETRFKIFYFKVDTYMRRLKYNN